MHGSEILDLFKPLFIKALMKIISKNMLIIMTVIRHFLPFFRIMIAHHSEEKMKNKIMYAVIMFLPISDQ